MRYQQIFRILNLKIYERIFKYISVDPHAGLIFMQFIWPGGAASRGHALPLHWLLKNQVSGLGSQPEVGTCPKNLQKAEDG